MCLRRLDMYRTIEMKERNVPIVGYKFLRVKKWRNSLDEEHTQYFSPYYDYFKWLIGITATVDRWSGPTEAELKEDTIDIGLHFFTEFNYAVDSIPVLSDYKYVIGVFEIRPEDVVAAGRSGRAPSFVATSATLKWVTESFKVAR